MTTLRFLRLLAFTLVLGVALVPSATLADVATVEVNADGSVQSEQASPGSTSKTGDDDKPKIDPNCPDRDHLMRCARVHLDTNKNGKLDRDELEKAISSLPWYAKGILKILGSVDKMMKKCDVDGDDAISIDYDMEHNKEQCLATCFKRRAFKGSFFPDCDL